MTSLPLELNELFSAALHWRKSLRDESDESLVNGGTEEEKRFWRAVIAAGKTDYARALDNSKVDVSVGRVGAGAQGRGYL